jgi:hypothetical protein
MRQYFLTVKLSVWFYQWFDLTGTLIACLPWDKGYVNANDVEAFCSPYCVISNSSIVSKKMRSFVVSNRVASL